jgi:RND family efflux transporter MFP subunit
VRKSTLGLLLLVACAKPNEYVAPPPPAVTVAPPERKDVIDYAEFTGITAATKVVEIRARVKGFLAEINYEPGRDVEKDTVLFQIDRVEYEAAVEAAEADLRSAKADLAAAETAIKSAQAALKLAETAVEKLERAYKERAVSEILVLEVQAKREVAEAELENAVARRDVAKAHVGVAESRLTRAKLDLGWTTIRAPLTGRVAKWNVNVGDLVGAGDPTLLTTMVNADRIWCYFDVAERWVLEVRKTLDETTPEDATIADLIVEMALIADEGYPHKGRGDYVEPTVDAETGTLRVRAVFDNPDGVILPGAFTRVRIPIAERKGALLVAERAVGQDQGGSFLLVVNSEDKVERRDVKLGAQHGHQVVVLEGIDEKDRVIVSGLQRARPGATVKPETAEKP